MAEPSGLYLTTRITYEAENPADLPLVKTWFEGTSHEVQVYGPRLHPGEGKGSIGVAEWVITTNHAEVLEHLKNHTTPVEGASLSD